MANNAQGLCASFKQEMLQGIHNLSAGGNTLKAALYFVNSSLGASTTAYSATGEVGGTGYTAGGVTVTNGTSPAVSGITAFWTPSTFTWTGLTVASAFDCCLLYNFTQSGRGIGVLTFPAQTISSGTFQVTMPANTPTSALLQAT